MVGLPTIEGGGEVQSLLVLAISTAMAGDIQNVHLIVDELVPHLEKIVGLPMRLFSMMTDDLLISRIPALVPSY